MSKLIPNENDKLENEINEWGCHYLLSHGYTLKSKLPELVQNTPWSYVARFATSDGYIYLKHTPELIALEAPVIQILHDQFQAHVPNVIAHNADLICFLMEDAGVSLRSLLKQNFNEDLLYRAIDQFTALQVTVAYHLDPFFNIGVPDWRLDKLPNLFKQFLLQREILISDGLSEIEISQLETLNPKISNLCEKLSGYGIKETMVQPDFNDNNSLLDEQSLRITMIDLGEIAITHPFFSLINFLFVIKKHHSISDEVYLRVKTACLKNFESSKHLLEAFEMAQTLWFVYNALAQYRLMQACGIEKVMSFQPGKLANLLKEFIRLATKY